MKNLIYTLLLLGLTTLLNAQMHGGGWNPYDTLTAVTVTGNTIIDSTMMHPMYYLDEDGDGSADYLLNFGPFWYQPDSSNSQRPNTGDVITISGGLQDYDYMPVNNIIVYEINGEFWRDPVIPSWNNMGGHSHDGGHHQGGCNGFAYGPNNGLLVDTTLNGISIVDTTFFMFHYYLDTDNNQQPDYYLNFGPPWYEPQSGASRPGIGESISIKGKLNTFSPLPSLIVYEINGVEWRDSSSIGNYFGGGWFHRNMTTGMRIHSPFDREDWMQMNPGWNTGGMMGGMGGMMGHDSLFGQMLEVFPQNIPFADNENVFAGYEIGMFSPQGNNGMWGNGGCGGMMNFNSNINYQLHYNDLQVQAYSIDENTIKAKYWNEQSNSWIQISNAVLDKTDNTINFPLSSVSNFVILTADQAQVTGIEENLNSNIIDYGLEQNYPNPFNPATLIKYSIPAVGMVTLKVFDVLGKEIATLVNESKMPGAYQINFDASDLSSGVYFYMLKSNKFMASRKMLLIR